MSEPAGFDAPKRFRWYDTAWWGKKVGVTAYESGALVVHHPIDGLDVREYDTGVEAEQVAWIARRAFEGFRADLEAVSTSFRDTQALKEVLAHG